MYAFGSARGCSLIMALIKFDGPGCKHGTDGQEVSAIIRDNIT